MLLLERTPSELQASGTFLNRDKDNPS